MADEIAKVQVIPPPAEAPSNASAPGNAEEDNSTIKQQDAKFSAKYPGMAKPNVSSIAQKRISRGGCQYFDSGDYNKDKKDGKAGVASQAPLAVTPGGAVNPGPSNLSALPRRMQRKPSGASRLGLPSQSPPKD